MVCQAHLKFKFSEYPLIISCRWLFSSVVCLSWYLESCTRKILDTPCARVFWPPCAWGGCWLWSCSSSDSTTECYFQIPKLVFLLVVEFYDHLLLGLCFNLPYLTPCTIYYLLEWDKPLSMCVMYILYALWFLLSSYVVLFLQSCVDSSLDIIWTTWMLYVIFGVFFV